MARPQVEPNVNERQIEALASIGCTMSEIAAVAEVSVDTLERRFAEVIKRGREKCKASIRRKQIEVAMSGQPAMLIWLGKQILGQREVVETINEHKVVEDPALQAQRVLNLLQSAQSRSLEAELA